MEPGSTLKNCVHRFFLGHAINRALGTVFTEPSKYHGFPSLFWPHIDYLADFSAETFCRLFCQLLCRDFVNFLSTFMSRFMSTFLSRFMSTEFFAYMFVKFFADLYLDPSQNGCLRHFCCTYSKRAGTSRQKNKGVRLVNWLYFHTASNPDGRNGIVESYFRLRLEYTEISVWTDGKIQ